MSDDYIRRRYAGLPRLRYAEGGQLPPPRPEHTVEREVILLPGVSAPTPRPPRRRDPLVVRVAWWLVDRVDAARCPACLTLRFGPAHLARRRLLGVCPAYDR